MNFENNIIQRASDISRKPKGLRIDVESFHIMHVV